MSSRPRTPWHHADSWRGDQPHRAVRAWLLASGIGGVMLTALLLAPPVSTPAPIDGVPAFVVSPG